MYGYRLAVVLCGKDVIIVPFRADTFMAVRLLVGIPSLSWVAVRVAAILLYLTFIGRMILVCRGQGSRQEQVGVTAIDLELLFSKAWS